MRASHAIRLVLAAGFSVLSWIVGAQERMALTLVRGHAPSYANVTLEFRVPVGFITDDYEVAGRITVGPEGDFSCPLRLYGTQLVILDAGIYRLYFYAQQGQRYTLGLPPYTPLGDAERLNPYRQVPELQLVLHPDDTAQLNVNDCIARFDMAQAQALDSAQAVAQAKKLPIPTDSINEALRAQFANCQDPFFQDYLLYREGMLHYVAQTKRVKALSDEYFKGRPIRYSNPAYRDLFATIYDRYFIFHGRTQEGHAIYQAISKAKSLSKLKAVLRQNDNLQRDALLELVILKGLHDEFFSGNFSRAALATILDSLNQTTEIAEHAFIANYIREKVTKLLPGFAPYPIRLVSTEGKMVDLHALRGKPVLLVFAMTTSYTCLQDFELLRKLHERMGERLQIVVLCADSNAEAMQRYVQGAHYPFTFAHIGDQYELLRAYDIRVYPTYFLLNERGLLELSPAPSPSEGLMQTLMAR